MNYFLGAYLLFLSQTLFAQLSNQEIQDLKGGRVVNDTSFIYTLPYEIDKRYMLIQGWQSSFSHQGELSLDFKMPIGTKICAAREGIVSDLKADSDEGGLNKNYLSKGNFVLVKHSDNSYAGYWHLQKDGVLVKIGDRVQKGQLIGISGNTGYSAFPHLHFWVYRYDAQGNLQTIPTRFQTHKGIRYLRPGRSYKRLN
jgi:murein DD-endopeptidase MepM/ murein hydrolase activator NlpD